MSYENVSDSEYVLLFENYYRKTKTIPTILVSEMTRDITRHRKKRVLKTKKWKINRKSINVFGNITMET